MTAESPFRVVPPSPGKVKYNRKQIDVILERIANGESIATVCATPGMPDMRSLRRWAIADKDGLAGRLRLALELRAHYFADEIIEIADDARNDWMAHNDPENPGYRLNGEAVNRSRLRIDTRKWWASKMLPRVYGDRYTVEGDPNAPLAVSNTYNLDFTGLSRDERAVVKAILVRRLAGPTGGSEGTDEG